MLGVKGVFKTGSKSYLKQFKDHFDDGLIDIGIEMARQAQLYVQVDTGLLRNSIIVTDGKNYYQSEYYGDTTRTTTPYHWTGYTPIGSPAEMPLNSDLLPISLVNKKHQIVVGTNVPYAYDMEFTGEYNPNNKGHEPSVFTAHDKKLEKNIGPRPFMQPARMRITSNLVEELMKRSLKPMDIKILNIVEKR